MRLRAQGFSAQRRDLEGTIVVLTDEGVPTGVEHTGNLSKTGDSALCRKAGQAGLDPEQCRVLLVKLLREIREHADEENE